MRSLFKLLAFLSFILFHGCEKSTDNPAVAEYMNLLLSGQYTSMELPDFKPTDIPALLLYRDETTIITSFPRNGISSLWAPECRLGMYVLWTIESIRAVEIKSPYLIGRFPSQNPILARRSSADLNLVYDDKSHKAAADAYYHWWHSIHVFKDKMKIDPLGTTDYKWH